jgi:MoaA/NifB/PqqE/SkfB family radical SAM enzyme
MYERLLGNDLVINEDSCNLSCRYCLTGQSNLKTGHAEQLIFETPRRDRYAAGGPLRDRIYKVLDGVDGQFGVPFLKITGGEVFLIHGIMDLIREMSERYAVLVVQTNGVLVRDAHLAELRKLGNVVVQVSLDSHRHHGNSYRVENPVLHAKVIANIAKILDSGLPVEIYAVLNDRSVEDVAALAEWLDGFEHPAVFFPFPIRGPDSDAFAMRRDQIHHVESLVDRYDELQRVLPPKAYFDRLLRLLRDGERRFRCHLPRLVISTFSDGVVTPCPNIWFNDMGNLVEQAPERALRHVGESGMYQALLAEEPRLAACKKCYTPWDLLSMYFEDEITLDELCQSPTYAPPAVRSLIAGIKEAYERDRAA